MASSETLSQALGRARSLLRESGFDSAALDARVLAANAFGLSAEQVLTKGSEPFEPVQHGRFWQLIERRLKGEPVAKIIGRREFWGVDFLVTPDVLDPRPESEVLIEACLDYVGMHDLKRAPLRVLDLGTGSGCLLSALLLELPNAKGIGVDKSPAALRVAQKNIEALGLIERAFLLCADWASALKQKSFDIVICNPPYIPTGDIDRLEIGVRDYDPRIALDGGAEGLSSYGATISQSFDVLKDTGYAVFEAGIGQAGILEEMMRGQSFSEAGCATEIRRDIAGVPRAVARVRQFGAQT